DPVICVSDLGARGAGGDFAAVTGGSDSVGGVIGVGFGNAVADDRCRVANVVAGVGSNRKGVGAVDGADVGDAVGVVVGALFGPAIRVGGGGESARGVVGVAGGRG